MRLGRWLALLGVALAADAAAAGLRKGPYLVYQNRHDEMLVMWQGSASPELGSWIEWGETGDFERGQHVVVENSAADQEHLYAYRLGPLSPGVRYRYAVTLDGDRRTGELFAPPVDSAGEWLIYALGDTRSLYHVHEQVIGALLNDRQVYSFVAPAIVLHAGDWVENGELEGYWDASVFGADNPSFRALLATLPVLGIKGNHEGKLAFFEKYWRYAYASPQPNEIYYSFDYGPAHVAALDYYTDYDGASAQYDWLRRDLEATTAPLKIVLLHGSPYAACGHHPDDAVAQRDLVPLFERTGVDLVIAGHNHFYARSVVNGITYLVTGGGGEELYVGDPSCPHVERYESAHHFVRLLVRPAHVEISAIRADGTAIESVLLPLDRTPLATGSGCQQSPPGVPVGCAAVYVGLARWRRRHRP